MTNIKTIGTCFPFHKTGMEAKISGAMPPTSSSGLVSKICSKSRKEAIQLWEDGPQKYFQTGKPKNSSEILYPSQKMSWRAGRLKWLVPLSFREIGMAQPPRSRRLWRVVNILSQKALWAHLNKGQTFSFKSRTEPRFGMLKAFNLGPALWVRSPLVPGCLHNQALLNLSTSLTLPAFHCHLLWLVAF